MNLPHFAKHAFRDKMGPHVQKTHAVWQSLSSRTEELDFLERIFFILTDFIFGVFSRRFRAAGHILWLAYSLTVLAAPGRLNPTWV